MKKDTYPVFFAECDGGWLFCRCRRGDDHGGGWARLGPFCVPGCPRPVRRGGLQALAASPAVLDQTATAELCMEVIDTARELSGKTLDAA